MKMIRLQTTTMTVLSEEIAEIAEIYRDKIWKLYGVPKTIFSDRRP